MIQRQWEQAVQRSSFLEVPPVRSANGIVCQTRAVAATAAPARMTVATMKKNASPFILKRPNVKITAIANQMEQVEIVFASSLLMVSPYSMNEKFVAPLCLPRP